MSGYFRIGGLFAPLLFYLLFANLSVNAETVEVFISARNSLNNAGVKVKQDILSSFSDKRVIVEFIGLAFSRFYYKNGNSIDSFDVNIDDAGNTKSLKEFIINAERYADDKKELIIWDHGNGWYNDIGTFAISYDSKTGHSIGVANGELKSVFDYCNTNYGIKFETVLFDACLMGEIEVADEIKDYSNYMIASPDLVPIISLDYKKIINNSDYLANIINVIHEYNSMNEKKYTIVNLKSVGSFISLFKESAADLRDLTMEGITEHVHYYPDKVTGDSIQCGLNNLLKLTGDERLISSFNSMVVNHSDTADISIFLPTSFDNYLSRIYEYRTTLFNKSLRWDSMLFPLYMIPDTFPPIAEEDTFIIAEKNNVDIKIPDYYDFYSDVYFNIYNLIGYNLIEYYNFENDDLPMANGWIRSSGESYSGNYAYYGSDADTISLNTFNEPLYISFYIYKYRAQIKFILYGAGVSKEWIISTTQDLEWNRYAFCDTSFVDSVKLICESNGGWAFLDNLKYGDFGKRVFLGEKKAASKVTLYNLKTGVYNIYLHPTDYFNNKGTVSRIINFSINQKAKAYIWPTGGNIDKIRHISIDDTSNLVNFSVFSIKGRKIAIRKNLDDRNFSMPLNAKYGIYYFVARTSCCNYKGKFAITH